ncbi:MAG: MerC domain-containing protein [Cyclobacteriaceae bacterium]
MNLIKTQSSSDFIGASASMLCLVHCLATPVLFVAQTCAISGCCSSISPGWWNSIDYVFIGITFFAVFFSARSTSREWMKFALYGSWVLLSLLVVNEKLTFLTLNEGWKYTAAVALISLHLYNRRYCRYTDAGCCIS